MGGDQTDSSSAVLLATVSPVSRHRYFVTQAMLGQRQTNAPPLAAGDVHRFGEIHVVHGIEERRAPDLFFPADRADELLLDPPAVRLVLGDLDARHFLIVAAAAIEHVVAPAHL